MAVATVTSVNVKQAVPFFGVTNMESSLRFYVDGLGFKMKNHWILDRAEDLQRVQLLPGNWFAPPGSNRGGSGGNKAVGALGVKGR